MKNSELKKMTVKQLRQTAKDWDVQIPNNLSKPKTLTAMLENKEFLAKLEIENPEIGFFMINDYKIELASNITNIASIKALVSYYCKFNDKKSSEIVITAPSGLKFKATELNNPRNFIKLKFGKFYSDMDNDTLGTLETQSTKLIIEEIIKNANTIPLNWEKMGAKTIVELNALILQTAKYMQSKGLLSNDSMKLIS